MIPERTEIAPRPALRVQLRGRDVYRLRAISGVIAAAGHRIVERAAEADVLFIDGDAEMEESEVTRAIVLGWSRGEPAALLPRDADAAQIDAAIRAVAAGLIVRATLAGGEGFGSLQEARTEVLLTPRELEVLTAIGQGSGNKAIARQLEISLHTVKFHVESIFRKLGVRTRAEAVAKAWDRSRGGVEL